MARPVDLFAIIDYDANGNPVSIMDRVEEAMRRGAFTQDIAARVGWPVATVRGWLRTGAEAVASVAQGNARTHELTPHQRQCAELHMRATRAEADARLMMLAIVQRQASGGHKRTETTTRVVNGRAVEITTRTIEAAPDARAATWMLEHRWAEDYGRRHVEVTGADGGPIEVDLKPARERLADLIEKAATASEASAEVIASATGSNGANGTNGNGHHQ